MHKIKLDIFEGPLDLLLFLIKKNEVDIYDIPIADVTRQYLEYLKIMQLLDLNIAGEFLVMAATLMQIKSKMLLPPEENPDEEQEEDPREELIQRLLEYKKFKEAAAHLSEKETSRMDIYTRFAPEEPKGAEDEVMFEASLFDLLSALSKAIKSIPKEIFHEIIKDEVTVEEKAHEILHMLVKHPVLYISELFRNSRTKMGIIAIFLAILELIKQKDIIVRQKEDFGDIEILRNEERMHESLKCNRE